MPYRSDEEFFPIWREPRSIWERTGLSPRQERRLDVSLFLLLVLFTSGWVYTAVDAVRRGDAPAVARLIGGAPLPLARNSPPEATFTMSALLERFVDWEGIRGASGEVHLVLRETGDTLALPASLPTELAVGYSPVGGEEDPDEVLDTETVPDTPGLWNLFLRMRSVIQDVPRLNIATLVPTSAIRNDRIGEYRIGRWPGGEGAYAPPRGFIEVTPDNMDTYVSTHFQLRDFLTKGQEGVWPKYVVLSTRLLDKLELTIQELERMGHPVENVFVVSGFRTPIYNATGGNPDGRGALSRHMYGDAADIAIDNNGDSCMDDLNGDGRVDVQDARVVAAAAEAVERRYPHLLGGIGIYPPERGAHCGMVHIDTRGHRARW